MAQTAAPKLPANPSNKNFYKNTKIGHFLRILSGATKAKCSKKSPTFEGSEITSAQIGLPINYYELKVQSSERFFAQTAAPKLPAKPSNENFSKHAKIGHFLRFLIEWTNSKCSKKSGDIIGSEMTSAQIALPNNSYALKVPLSENFLAQTAAPKLPAKPSNDNFCKHAKIGHFLRFLIGRTKAKCSKKSADFKGSEITSAQMALSVQQSENFLAQRSQTARKAE